MKKLCNGKANLIGEKALVPYFRMAIECLEAQPTNGFTIKEMARRMRVIEQLDIAKEEDVVELEDADAACLLECIESMRWAMCKRDIVTFVEQARKQLAQDVAP